MLGAVGCGTSGGTKLEGPVTVYVSLPLSGPRATDGRDAADGARLALEEAGGKAGELEVRAEFLDDARGRPWDPAAVGENARTAAQDSSTAAYIGELDSQPTRASLPILNQAGIAQISPGATAVDLTRPAQGYPESPDRYRPSEDPTFARLVPDDAALARAAAALAAEVGLEAIALDLGDGRFAEFMRSELEADAGEVGIQVVPPGEAVQGTLGTEATTSLALHRAGGGDDYLIAAVLDPDEAEDRGLTAAQRNGSGRLGGPYALYGYEAMELALASIEAAEDTGGDFRPSVVDSLLEAERPDSILGSYSIDENGDSTLCGVQIYMRRGGALIPRKPVCPEG